MLQSFRKDQKALKELFETGHSARVNPDLHQRCIRRLDALAAARKLPDLNLPGFNLHQLRGLPRRYSIHVNGPWCITFEWSEPYAHRVALEQYH